MFIIKPFKTNVVVDKSGYEEFKYIFNLNASITNELQPSSIINLFVSGTNNDNITAYSIYINELLLSTCPIVFGLYSDPNKPKYNDKTNMLRLNMTSLIGSDSLIYVPKYTYEIEIETKYPCGGSICLGVHLKKLDGKQNDFEGLNFIYVDQIEDNKDNKDNKEIKEIKDDDIVIHIDI